MVWPLQVQKVEEVVSHNVRFFSRGPLRDGRCRSYRSFSYFFSFTTKGTLTLTHHALSEWKFKIRILWQVNKNNKLPLCFITEHTLTFPLILSLFSFSLSSFSLSHPPHQWYYCTIWCGLSHLTLASLFLSSPALLPSLLSFILFLFDTFVFSFLYSALTFSRYFIFFLSLSLLVLVTWCFFPLFFPPVH